MQRHSYFNLWLHTDQELEALLGAPLTARRTLHEWPLSCVQALELAGGLRLVYKAQFQEGVEADFYARARSPLLAGCRDLGAYHDTRALLLEWIDAPRLADLRLSKAHSLAHARRLVEGIARIEGDPPVYADLGSPADWLAWVDATCARLAGLVAGGAFRVTTPGAAARLAAWARSAEALAAFSTPPVLAHADLRPENIFVTPGGYQVIDWQYPRRTPPGFDLAGLLESQGHDPFRYVPPGVVKMVWMVRLGWFVECKARLFPQGEPYDADVAELARRIAG